MTRFTTFTFVATLTLASCSETSSDIDGGATADASASVDAGTLLDAAAPDASTPSDAAAGDDATTVDAAAAADAARGDSGPSTASVAMTDAFVWANCTPGVTGDRLLASWTIDIRGTASTAVFVEGSLTITRGGTDTTQSITIDPSDLTLAGGRATTSQSKASGSPLIAGCGLCGDGATADVSVTYDIGGERVSSGAQDLPFLCTY